MLRVFRFAPCYIRHIFRNIVCSSGSWPTQCAGFPRLLMPSLIFYIMECHSVLSGKIPACARIYLTGFPYEFWIFFQSMIRYLLAGCFYHSLRISRSFPPAPASAHFSPYLFFPAHNIRMPCRQTCPLSLFLPCRSYCIPC